MHIYSDRGCMFHQMYVMRKIISKTNEMNYSYEISSNVEILK